jgi:ABC-type multidrug transport system fused ATPase/permease subunit
MYVAPSFFVKVILVLIFVRYSGRNLTSVEFCPEGNYCIGGVQNACDRGYYCPRGTAYPYECPFGALSCPGGSTAYPNDGAVFIVLVIIFCLVLGTYWLFGRFRIRNEVTRGWDDMATSVSTRAHDTMNEVTMEHDQHAVAKAMDNIHSNMLAREKAVSTTKWANMLEDDALDATVRFTEEFSRADVEQGGSAANSPRTKRSSLPDGSRLSGGVGLGISANNLKPNAIARKGSVLLSTLEASMAHFEYDEVATPLTVSFTHMYLTLKVSNTPVLTDICVSIKPFHVTAIMGPSGAGKTSLLSLLRGQAHYANIFGEITVNGHAVESLEIFRRRSAYVPQEDIVNEDLSVEENILYSALLFNRRGLLRAAELMPMVLRAEKLLDICHIRTSVVGSATRRGISGGQKKRVSIGMWRHVLVPLQTEVCTNWSSVAIKQIQVWS